MKNRAITYRMYRVLHWWVDDLIWFDTSVLESVGWQSLAWKKHPSPQMISSLDRRSFGRPLMMCQNFTWIFFGITTYSPEISKYGLNFSAKNLWSKVRSWVHYTSQRGRYVLYMCGQFLYRVDTALFFAVYLEDYSRCRSCANKARRSSKTYHGVRVDLRKLGLCAFHWLL